MESYIFLCVVLKDDSEDDDQVMEVPQETSRPLAQAQPIASTSRQPTLAQLVDNLADYDGTFFKFFL